MSHRTTRVRALVAITGALLITGAGVAPAQAQNVDPNGNPRAVRAFFPTQFGFGVGAFQKPYVAIIGTNCVEPGGNNSCPSNSPDERARNSPAGTAKITVSAVSQRQLKLPSRTLAKGTLKAGNAGSGVRMVSGAAMKERLKVLHKKWDAAGNPALYVRATVTLRLTSPVAETLTRSGRYELGTPAQGDIVGSKYDTFPCGGCKR
jgi:hypothetical protein